MNTIKEQAKTFECSGISGISSIPVVFNIYDGIDIHLYNSSIIRYPKDESIARQWNRAIGYVGNKKISGLICFKHFKDDHLKKNQNGIVQLISGAVPSIDVIATEIISESGNENHESTESTSSISDLSIPFAPCVQCVECILKDLTIKKLESKINSLQKELKLTQNQAYYFKAAK